MSEEQNADETPEPPGFEKVVIWRGSVRDLVTDLSALLTLRELQELTMETALEWRNRRGP